MQELISSRLKLTALTLAEADFITELVNTPGWLRFIGERNVKTHADAVNYIQKIIDNQHVKYWIVKLKETGTAIGIITIIKRDYLTHHDIGFAFLPAYEKRGYAFEAADIVLTDMKNTGLHTQVLATTLPENTSSIRLLEKLGLKFDEKITAGETALLLYGLEVR